MTIIAAYKGPDGIFLGGDSLAADSNDTVYLLDPKVFELSGFTVGFAGSFRFGQVLKNCFLPPPHNPAVDDSCYMFSVWVESLRETLESYGILKVESGYETIGEDGSALVVYRDNIYQIQEDFSVLKVSTPYAAIGVGQAYAVGAMHALNGMGLPGREVLQKALGASVTHAPRCGGTLTILEHDPSKEEKWVKPKTSRKATPVSKSSLVL